MGNRAVRAGLTFLLWGAALGLAYGQSPLYTSNQNQYYLHGFAQAGFGQLGSDWLANTRDPIPLFTALARLMAPSAVGNPLPLRAPALWNYALYLLIFGVYLGSGYGIARSLFALGSRHASTLLFFGVLFVTHSAALRFVLTAVPGGEWAYLFDGGLAGQRLLGPVFQPSVFGALLLLSIWLYLRDRPLPAMWLTALAASVHPTYLLSAGTLSAVYWMGLAKRSRGIQRPLIAAASTLVLVLPIMIYLILNFLPQSEAAQRILVEFRVPDHAVPAEWFDLPSTFKLLWIVAALVLVRRTRLLPVLLALLGIGSVLTLGQLLSGSLSLALLFPWRATATLVPLATIVLAGQAASWLAAPAPVAGRQASPIDGGPDRTGPGSPLRPPLAQGIGLALVLLSVISGLAWSAVQFEQRRRMPEQGLFAFVRRTASPGQLYLVPAKMQDFRLATGAPILADFKSIPYYAPEVVEWHQRVRLLDFFYRGAPEQVDCGLLEVFSSEYGVTHVVTEPDQHGLTCDRLDLQYDDGAFSLYALSDGQP